MRKVTLQPAPVWEHTNLMGLVVKLNNDDFHADKLCIVLMFQLKVRNILPDRFQALYALPITDIPQSFLPVNMGKRNLMFFTEFEAQQKAREMNESCDYPGVIYAFNPYTQSYL